MDLSLILHADEQYAAYLHEQSTVNLAKVLQPLQLPSIGILELKNIQFFWFYSRSSITN
jgi:hypothetical protein